MGCKMCGPLFAFWVGRSNSGPISERADIRGGNANSRDAKLQALNNITSNSEKGVDDRRWAGE